MNAKLGFVMRRNNILPEHACTGELPLEDNTAYMHHVQCASCGTEFTFQPDSDWVTVSLPGMKTALRDAD